MNPLVMWIVRSTIYFRISDGKSLSRKKRVGFVFRDLLYSYLFLGYHKLSAKFSQVTSLKCLLVSVRLGVSVCKRLIYKYTDIYLKLMKLLCHDKHFNNPATLHSRALTKLKMTTWRLLKTRGEILFASVAFVLGWFFPPLLITSGNLVLWWKYCAINWGLIFTSTTVLLFHLWLTYSTFCVIIPLLKLILLFPFIYSFSCSLWLYALWGKIFY